MKYIIPAILIPILGIIYLAERDYQAEQDSLKEQSVKIDSLQTIVDNCEARVNDMRMQRDHAIDINTMHQDRWNEIIRVRPD